LATFVENALTYSVKSFVFFISPERINAVRSAVESYFLTPIAVDEMPLGQG
jgi:hypothetical protein